MNADQLRAVDHLVSWRIPVNVKMWTRTGVEIDAQVSAVHIRLNRPSTVYLVSGAALDATDIPFENVHLTKDSRELLATLKIFEGNS